MEVLFGARADQAIENFCWSRGHKAGRAFTTCKKNALAPQSRWSRLPVNSPQDSQRHRRAPVLRIRPPALRFTKHGRCCVVHATAEVSNQSGASIRIAVDKSDFPDKVKFGRAQDGRNFAIVISKVERGSNAEKEGLKEGQKLLAISSPMQSGASGEMWQVNERPSLRFVQDAVRMTRVSQVTLELTRNAILSGAPVTEDPKTTLMDSMEEALEQEGEKTIADKLAEAYKEDEDSASREKAQRDRRIQRRRDYMDRESTRDNSKFFIGLAASFFLPAAGILAYAFSSGLLDRIGNSYRPY